MVKSRTEFEQFTSNMLDIVIMFRILLKNGFFPQTIKIWYTLFIICYGRRLRGTMLSV